MAEQPTVVVRGEATREVPPEQAVLTISAAARDRDREAVPAQLAERTAAVRAVLAEFAEAIEKSETSHLSVYPDFKRRGERPVTYVGDVTTTVTVTDFAVLGELVLGLTAIEQVAVSGPWWRLRPGSKAGAEVRREAIADALVRAHEYADAVGARIDRLVEIADEGIAAPRGFMAMAGASDGAPIELDPEMQTVQASVTLRATITEPQALSRRTP